MCGICGFAGRGAALTEATLARMNDTLRRRGPDEAGSYVDDGVGLAMRRLSIIDLAGGQQPVRSDDGRYVMVFNGEIYNYRELRESLIAAGRRFRSHGDAEVIVNLFAERGLAGLKALRGMYGVAIWDTQERCLWLIRDPLGIKPLYYGLRDGQLLFGSEIKAVRAAGVLPDDIDHQALDAYLAYNYIPPPLSIYTAIRKLEPGQALRFDAGGMKLLQHDGLLDHLVDTAVDVEAISAELRRSVSYHMVSDVPVGVFLSGGLDSSALTVEMQRISERPVDAFTIRFDEPDSHLVDESPVARELKTLHGFNLQERTVTLDLDRVLPEAVAAFDEPFADDSIFPTYEVCRIAAQSLKVCVSGAGGDELFGGYNRYQGLALQSTLNGWTPGWLRPTLGGVGRAAAGVLGPHTRRGDLVDRFSRRIGASFDDAWIGYISSMEPQERLALYSADARERIDAADTRELIARHLRRIGSDDPLKAAMYADTQTYLCEDVLALSDRIGMWHSLEVRVPLSDIELAGRAFSIPGRDHVDARSKKKVLRAAIRDWLPESIFSRPKQGFESPMAAWLRGHAGAALARTFEARDSALGSLIDLDRAGELLVRHRRGQADHAKILFALMVLAEWLAQSGAA